MNKKNIIKYLILFVYFFISLVFIFTLSRGDTYVNFGFSYAVSIGEIPYNDFNMVISPLAPYLYSIGLFISTNIIVYYLEQALLLCVLFYFVEKIINKKYLLFLLVLSIPYPIAMVTVLFPGYNYLILLLFIIFIYCFDKNKYYLLGFLLGLLFCTKQTIGLVVFIPTIYYLFKDRKIFIKMFIGYIIPIIVLLIYLLFNNSLFNFIDLCFLGLFDFGNSNSSIDMFYLIMFILGILYFIIRIIRDKNNILLYYALCFSSVSLPIIDYYHVSLFLVIVFLFIIKDITIKDILYKYIVIFIICLDIIWTVITYHFIGDLKIVNYNNFGLSIITKDDYKYTNELLKYVDSLDKEVIYFMRGSENYFYKITTNRKLNYYDLPNYGNYGYDGLNKMKKKINSKKDVYFVIDRKLVKNNDSFQQYTKELGQIIIDKGKLKRSIGIYDIYYKE